jgi:hypothetical protein
MPGLKEGEGWDLSGKHLNRPIPWIYHMANFSFCELIMSFVSIWIHAVWSTKYRIPSLDESIRQDVFDHMVVNARKKGILVDRINGYVDHVHKLLALKNTQSIQKLSIW